MDAVPISAPQEDDEFGQRFTSELERLETPAEIGAYLQATRAKLNAPSAWQNNLFLALPVRNAALVDAVLRRLFALVTQKLAPENLSMVDGLAIVATGGYGRGTLFPFSDVDLTFAVAREDDPHLNVLIQEMFQQVMDVFLYGANLKVGYAYRLMTDLGQLDHQTQTSLLDARFLCGDETLFQEFRRSFRAHLLTADFLFRKWAERQAVLEKHGGTRVYHVEPNVKEGAGGLRDVQTAEWIGEVRFRIGPSRLWPALVEHGFLTQTEAEQIGQSSDFLQQVRCALHVVSSEVRDLLTAPKQEAVAALLAYPETEETPAVEAFMRDYYTHASGVQRLSQQVVRRCLDSEIPMGLGLASQRRELIAVDPEPSRRDPAWPLHIAELSQAYSLHISDSLEETITQYRTEHPRPEDTALAGRVFTRLLSAPHSVADTMEHLADTDVLSWLIPEFGPLMTLIPYDAAHDYTVGEHSLHVVRNIEEVKSTADPRLLEMKRIAGEVANPEVLLLAGLIHDLGKQWPRSAHAETGAVAADQIAERLGWDEERRRKLVFLVRHHLQMAETSRLRDLALEETVEEFVQIVPDLDALNMLYILTWADTLAVGLGVWSEFQGKQLAELYHRSEAVLSEPQFPAEAAPPGDKPASIPEVSSLARQRERIRKQLAQRNLPADLIYEHIRSLSAQYLLNTPLEEIYLHLVMIGRLRDTFQPVIDFRNEQGAESTELTLCAFDDPKPGLLAKITGVLYAQDINVHAAQVFTRDNSLRIAIDTLWVDFRGRPLPPGKRTEAHESLKRVLLGEIGVGELLKQRRKSLIEQSIYSARIDDTASDRFSLLEVSAPDEAGVLYRLARAVSALGWNIHAARLSIWGSRARVAFYLTDAERAKIPAAEVERLCATLTLVTFPRRQASRPAAESTASYPARK